MSGVKVVRQRIEVGAGARRRPEERLALRFPGLAALFSRVVYRSPPESRLRRAIVRHVVRTGFEAVNRGDFEAAFALYHPDVEVTEPPEIVELGLDPVSRGRAGRIHVQQRWQGEWGEIRFEPYEVLDVGDQLLVTGRMRGRGAGSGATFDSELANLFTLSGGRVIRERMFLDRAKALEALGLSEEAFRLG